MNSWPVLNYNELKETYQTVHRWTQIVGKLRLSKSDWINHSWHSTLYVTPVGLSTSPIPDGGRYLSIEFDFVSHQLAFVTSLGEQVRLPLISESVAAFYHRFKRALTSLGIESEFDLHPNELPDVIPLDADTVHATYIRSHAHDIWAAMLKIDQVLKRFRSQFIGKCSPVHFFWGSFDLAVTRFSGRPAPMHPGGVPHLPDRVVREAYSHEVSSCGFWPGNDAYPQAAFYSYAYPEPPGFSHALIKPEAAFYHEGLHEFILPYEHVRRARSSDDELMHFLKSTYTAAADLGKWDRDALENSPYLLEMQRAYPRSKAREEKPRARH